MCMPGPIEWLLVWWRPRGRTKRRTRGHRGSASAAGSAMLRWSPYRRRRHGPRCLVRRRCSNSTPGNAHQPDDALQFALDYPAPDDKKQLAQAGCVFANLAGLAHEQACLRRGVEDPLILGKHHGAGAFGLGMAICEEALATRYRRELQRQVPRQVPLPRVVPIAQGSAGDHRGFQCRQYGH